MALKDGTTSKNMLSGGLTSLLDSGKNKASSAAGPAAAAAPAAAANRRVARAPPGTKTPRARHGRTNMPQSRTEKVPNVPSESHRKSA